MGFGRTGGRERRPTNDDTLDLFSYIFVLVLRRTATGQPSAQTKCWSRSGNDMGSDLFFPTPALYLFSREISFSRTSNNIDDSYNNHNNNNLPSERLRRNETSLSLLSDTPIASSDNDDDLHGSTLHLHTHLQNHFSPGLDGRHTQHLGIRTSLQNVKC